MFYSKAIGLFGCWLFTTALLAQSGLPADSIDTGLQFEGDFRFRFEIDWNSRQSDGTMRDDRTRLRYRFRFGVSKQLNTNFKMGAGVRTGNLNNQQGPHITLGNNAAEFGLTRIGFEKMWLRYQKNRFWFWLGKKNFPFWSQHELLWNENVFPEGISTGFLPFGKKAFQLSITAGHYIFRAGDQFFDSDSYLSIIQLAPSWQFSNDRQLTFILLNMYGHKLPDIPDNQHQFFLDYNILMATLHYKFQLGIQQVEAGLDFYINTIDYDNYQQIAPNFRKEKVGFVAYCKYGQLQKKGDFSIHLYYAYLEKFAIIDYLAQNDWGRWSYREMGAYGARLSNFHGIEIRTGYNITENIDLIARFYIIEQLKATGIAKETGTRFRIDVNARL